MGGRKIFGVISIPAALVVAIAAIAVMAIVVVVVPDLSSNTAPAGQGNGESAAGNSGSLPEAKGLKVTHYVGGLPYVYGVSGEVDGTYGGHTILVTGGGTVINTGQRFAGIEFDFHSCKLSGNKVYATAVLTNTLGETADFSFTADLVNQQPDGSLVSQTVIGTAAYQVFKLPAGQRVTVKAVGDVYPGTVTGPNYGCDVYQLIAAVSKAHYPY